MTYSEIEQYGKRLTAWEEIFCYFLFGSFCALLAVAVYKDLMANETSWSVHVGAVTIFLGLSGLTIAAVRNHFMTARQKRMELLWKMVSEFHQLLICEYKHADTGNRHIKAEAEVARTRFQEMMATAPRSVKRSMSDYITIVLKPLMTQGLLNTDITGRKDEMLKKDYFQTL